MKPEIVEEVACIILYDSNHQVLLQQRTDDAERLPGYWAFFGGGTEDNETAKEAAIREAHEELNYVARDPRLVIKQKFRQLGQNDVLGNRAVKNVFMELCQDKSSLKLREGKGWGWFEIDETKKLKMVSHDQEALQHIKNLLTTDDKR